MADIRYVVLSDLHLGAENSVLTNIHAGTVNTDPTEPAPLLIKLADCLKEIISKNKSDKKPILVLNGDLAELALTTMNKAGMAYQRFFELVMPANGELLFDKNILFLPGNHDHNLWERARDYHYNGVINSMAPRQDLPAEIYQTAMFEPEKIRSPFLSILLQCYPHLRDACVNVCYPAHAVLNKDKSKCVIFCHGHYVESMYSLMTTLRSDIFPDRPNPTTLEELEMENFAWVDFFWSTLGRSGSVGKDIDLIYDKLQSANQVNIMLENIATSLTKKKKKGLVRWLEKKALLFILKKTAGHMAATERNEPDVELTPDSTQGLKNIMENEIYNQLKSELGSNIPPEVSFIFGHTHKPFLRKMQFKNYQQDVSIFNSGGWVVDTMQLQPLHGGSVILVDDDLDVVSLQMYKEGNYQVSFNELSNGNGQSPLYQRLVAENNLAQEPWTGFAKTAEQEVDLRCRLLKIIVKENN